MYVRAIYIPLCKKISSWPPPPPSPPPRPYLSVSSRLSTPFPPFLSSCRVSRLSRPPLEPPAHRYPRVCNANTHQPDVLANCLCFYRARIFLRPRRGARVTTPSRSNVFLSIFSRLVEQGSRRILWRSSRSRSSFGFFFGKVGKKEKEVFWSKLEDGGKIEDWTSDGKVKVKEKAERFFWGWLRVN